MSRRGNRRVSFCPPDMNEKPTMCLKQSYGSKVGRNRKRVVGVFSFRLPKTSGFSPIKFLQRLSTKVAKALHTVSMRRKRTASPSLGNKNMYSSSSMNGSRSRSFVAPVDSHRTEAIEDCIQFFNSSSSLERSNSVCATSSS